MTMHMAGGNGDPRAPMHGSPEATMRALIADMQQWIRYEIETLRAQMGRGFQDVHAEVAQLYDVVRDLSDGLTSTIAQLQRLTNALHLYSERTEELLRKVSPDQPQEHAR